MKAIALALLAALPAFAMPKDKQLHVTAGAIVAAPVYCIAKAKGVKHPELWAVGAAVAVGDAGQASPQ